MSPRWSLGEAEVEGLLAARDLQRLSGEAANGERLLVRATTTLTTARRAIDDDPDSAYVLAYDAARHALTGLLAQQGLRPTTQGGHYAVERAVRAQFGQGFRQFGTLRRRRHELEYPANPDDEASSDEANDAVEHAEAIVASARGLIDRLGLF